MNRFFALKFKNIFLFSVLFLLLFFLFFIFKESSDSWSVEENDKLPIVYSDNYNISLLGIQKLHPFDSEKYGKVVDCLVNNAGIKKSRFYRPEKISEQDLLLVHTPRYLDSLNKSATIAQIAEISLLNLVPNFILQERLLDSVRYASGGTILGAELAMREGWSINLSGGYHHTKADSSGGFGFYADVPIAVYKLWQNNPDLKVLIVDLDAHQGNGNESILKDDPRIFIFDVYGEDNYPHDELVKKYIDFNWPVGYLYDEEYLSLIREEIPNAIQKSSPDLIIYNAGTDIFEKDPLGRMGISKQGIIERDEIIFENAQKNDIPILMVLSGGYTSESAGIIGASIENLLENVIREK